jgi:hypothetical protein
MSRPPFEERQHALNPHRDEDRAHAADMAYAQLKQRGIQVTGEEGVDDLATLIESVERFEAAVSALGGDRMTNAPDSTQPDDPRLVMPARKDDESVRDYIRRVDAATEGLGRGVA